MEEEIGDKGKERMTKERENKGAIVEMRGRKSHPFLLASPFSFLLVPHANSNVWVLTGIVRQRQK